MALILFAFLVVTMGMLDLGIGVFRYHVLANAARHGVRMAIVHGELADRLGPWGPSDENPEYSIDEAADAEDVEIVAALQPLLVGCNLSETRIQVDWPEGTNKLNAPVRVIVTTPYQPVLTFIFPGGGMTLSASSTMPIAH